MFEGSDTSIVLQQLQSSGEVALSTLFEKYRDNLRSLIKGRNRLTTRFDESDIIQEAFLRAKSKLDAYLEAPTVHPGIWIRAQCRQVVYDHTRFHLRECRNPKREIDVVEGEPLIDLLTDSSDSVGTQLQCREDVAEIKEAVSTLHVVEQEILQMRIGEGMRFREIGEALELKTDAVKKRYYRALDKIKKTTTEQFGSATSE